MMHRVVAVNVAKGPTIMLASGKLFDFLDPHGSDFDIDDVAHGLAHVCRYAGQCRAFYSVAEHSMLAACRSEMSCGSGYSGRNHGH